MTSILWKDKYTGKQHFAKNLFQILGYFRFFISLAYVVLGHPVTIILILDSVRSRTALIVPILELESHWWYSE